MVLLLGQPMQASPTSLLLQLTLPPSSKLWVPLVMQVPQCHCS